MEPVEYSVCAVWRVYFQNAQQQMLHGNFLQFKRSIKCFFYVFLIISHFLFWNSRLDSGLESISCLCGTSTTQASVLTHQSLLRLLLGLRGGLHGRVNPESGLSAPL